MTTQQDRYYVTTPIYYVNANPHIGHAYSTILADSMMRFHKFLGKETFFMTGTDEHGDKIKQAAEAAGKTPFEFATDISNKFRQAWKDLGLEPSHFIRTTDESHKKVVRDILTKIHNKGDIYFGEYGGNYCFGCERFLTDKELVDGKCPDHQKPTTHIKENNYFFKMSKYQDRLVDYINKNPDFIRPERYKNEVLAMLREPLDDLCISRPKTRLDWGIELPFDSNYVTYVWFDALINYLSGIGYPDSENFKNFWPVCEHITAKDIVKPHAVYWPTMLMAAEIPLYKHLNVHGYWINQDAKMSKSLGNMVDPISLKDKYGIDAIRYFLFREMSFGLDGNFSMEAFEGRYNSDLANNLGNLVSRSLAMIEKYRQSKVPTCGKLDELSSGLKEQAATTISDVLSMMERMEIHRAMERIWSLIDAGNVYVDRTKPWSLAKEEKTNNEAVEQLNTTLYCQLELIRIISGIISPFMPTTAKKILTCLGYSENLIESEAKLDKVNVWGGLKAGTVTNKGEILFPKMDVVAKEDTAKPVSKAEKTQAAETPENVITFDDFGKVQLRVAQILEAEKLEKSEKLIRLQVDVGPLGKRQIVAGIAKYYKAEELIGRKIVIVANLKPAKLMGHESKGMLLAASDDDGHLELVSVGPLIALGSSVS